MAGVFQKHWPPPPSPPSECVLPLPLNWEKYRPPTPLTAQRVCPPLTPNWGRTQLQGGEGVGGSIC